MTTAVGALDVVGLVAAGVAVVDLGAAGVAVGKVEDSDFFFPVASALD